MRKRSRCGGAASFRSTSLSYSQSRTCRQQRRFDRRGVERPHYFRVHAYQQNYCRSSRHPGSRRRPALDFPALFPAKGSDSVGDVREEKSPTDVAEAGPLIPDRPSIACCPFKNMSGDPEQDYFADGVVEEIITALSRFRQLFVIARNSSFTYKGRAIDVKRVGRELGVRYVLEGSVRRAANRVRITAQLIDAQTGAHLWADRFDGMPDDIFDLQDQITSGVVGVIAPKIEQAEIETRSVKTHRQPGRV